MQPDPIELKMERPTSSPLLQTIMPVPKGRGRPRASYAQTGEFDLGLIREYRSRPALYDRTNKRFKDKMHTAQLWMQISHKLGYDGMWHTMLLKYIFTNFTIFIPIVSILRERMITLRNRYNIEKRRVENSSLSSSIVGSQWPLFDNLSFLSEHIRSRRSYKMQSKSLDGRPEEDEDEEHFDVDDMTSVSNDVVKDIKHEFESGEYDETDEYDCDRQLPVTTVLKWVVSNDSNCCVWVLWNSILIIVSFVDCSNFRSIPMATQLTNQQSYSTQRNGSGSGNQMLNGKCATPSNNVNTHLVDACHRPDMVIAMSKQKRAAQPMSGEEISNKRRLLDATREREYSTPAVENTATTYPKFRAFGEFLSHSLTELPHTTAMRLVEKFTRELVQAAIAVEEPHLQQQNSQSQGEQQKQEQTEQQQEKQGSAEPSSMDEMDE